jgi:hypothetical protein
LINPTRIRGSTIDFVTAVTAVIAFGERAGGVTAIGGGGGRAGRAGDGAFGADAQAARVSNERVKAIRFIDTPPCKKRDSAGVGCGSSLFSEVHFSNYDTQTQNDPDEKARP